MPTVKLRRLNKPIAGQYIVVFSNDLAASTVSSVANELTQKHGGQIKYVYEHVLKGFALQASEAQAIALSRDSRVQYVEEAGEVVVTGVQQPIVLANFGSGVDLFAPGGDFGQAIPTASNASDQGLDGFAFTSAAAPHVTGVVAQYLEQFSVNSPNDPATSPANVSATIVNNASVNKLSNIGTGSPNRLLYSGFVAPPATNPILETRFFVRQEYYDFMRRQPDPGGWDFHSNNINACGSDAACITLWRATTVRGFMESPEFRDAHPILRDNPVGSQAYDEEFIRQLYRCTLQREADPGGLAFHMDFITTFPGSYTVLIGHFIESPEYLQRFQ